MIPAGNSSEHSFAARAAALLAGLICHVSFAVGVGAMALGLATGMQSAYGSLTGASAWLANSALALQFPLLHSYFLSRRGRRNLTRPFPGAWGRDLSTTLFATFASLQLVATFLLWSPIGPSWTLGAFSSPILFASFAAGWLFLGKAMLDAGLGLQTGWLGWFAVARGRRPRYGPLPDKGLFRRCRQPIYFAFLWVMLAAPGWSPDRLLLLCVWGPYCYLGPKLKEARFSKVFGEAFEVYRHRVPYFLPLRRVS